jgi:hypothetical protein
MPIQGLTRIPGAFLLLSLDLIPSLDSSECRHLLSSRLARNSYYDLNTSNRLRLLSSVTYVQRTIIGQDCLTGSESRFGICTSPLSSIRVLASA